MLVCQYVLQHVLLCSFSFPERENSFPSVFPVTAKSRRKLYLLKCAPKFFSRNCCCGLPLSS